MNVEEVVKESFQMLQLVLEDAFETDENPDERTAFVYRHAITVKSLAEEVMHLEADGYGYSSAIIVRSMLECLFNLAAAVAYPSFAVEKLIWETEEEAKKIRKWIEATSETNLEETIGDLESISLSLRKKYNVSARLNWNSFECAKAADLVGHYRREYFIYSKAVHVTASGIISRENRVGRGHVLQTVLFALLYAAGMTVQAVPTKNGQEHIDATGELMGKLTDIVNANCFRDMDKAQQIPFAD
jgi:hypothetical protein